MKEKIVFIHDSRYAGFYKCNEHGYLVGFCRGGDDIPYAIVRKADGMYVMADIHHIKYNGE